MAQTLYSAPVQYHQTSFNPVIPTRLTETVRPGFVIEFELGSTAQQVQLFLKRVLDIVLSLIGLAVLSPLFLIVAVAIKIDSKGPAFYLSERIGKDYKPFRMFKFRTMRTNAEAEREKLRQQENLNGQLFKIKDDPRVTPLGKLLRKTSLDELPQLINVLLGNMSLVGPRPLPEDESALFNAPYTKRFSVLPGITGAWQVYGRSDADFNRLCDLEYQHLSDWHLIKDVRLLLETVPAVLMSKGAY